MDKALIVSFDPSPVESALWIGILAGLLIIAVAWFQTRQKPKKEKILGAPSSSPYGALSDEMDKLKVEVMQAFTLGGKIDIRVSGTDLSLHATRPKYAALFEDFSVKKQAPEGSNNTPG